MLSSTGQAARFPGAGFKACQRTWQSGEGGDDEGRVSDEGEEGRAQQERSASLEEKGKGVSPSTL